MGFSRDTRTLWTRRLRLQSQNLRRLAWHLRLVKSSSKPMERWFSIVAQCSYQHSSFCFGFPCCSYQRFSFCSGSPPKPRAHAGHQVFLPEHPRPQRRVGIDRQFSWNLFFNFRCTMSQMTDVQLQTKENLARNFLEIARKILPGISRLKVALG